MTAKTTDQARRSRCSELLVLDGTLWIHIGSAGWAGLGWAGPGYIAINSSSCPPVATRAQIWQIIGSARSEVRRLPGARPINGGYKN